MEQDVQKIDSFRFENEFLSNFYMVDVIYEGIRYRNSEAAFQAQKCADILDRFQFGNLVPGKAKRLGRKVKLRPDWEDVKDNLMYEIVKAKFQLHPVLRDKLLETGDALLVEENTWNDDYWGTVKGVGQNKLGKILMGLRDEFRKGIIK